MFVKLIATLEDSAANIIVNFIFFSLYHKPVLLFLLYLVTNTTSNKSQKSIIEKLIFVSFLSISPDLRETFNCH